MTTPQGITGRVDMPIRNDMDERAREPIERLRFECRCMDGKPCPVHPDDLIDERDE